MLQQSFFSSSLLCGLELIYYRAETWQRSRHNNLKNVHTKIQRWVSWFILSQSLPENSVLRNRAQLMHKWACNPVYFIFQGKKKKDFWHFSCYRHNPDYEQKPEPSFKKAMFLHSCFQQRITLLQEPWHFCPLLHSFSFSSENLDFLGLWHPYNG